MSRRFFTADFHFGMDAILDYEKRPFQTISQMNEDIIEMCNKKATEDDVIVHVGDLACYNSDNLSKGLKVNPQQYIKKIHATIVNVRGNHDLTNKVKSVCQSMRTNLGKYMDVSISHYPSYDDRSSRSWIKGDIHICGHVHGKWKHCLDIDNKVLNINVGIDVWNYQIVSEEQLINYIDHLLKIDRKNINKVIKDNFGHYIKV